jgi:hypothetical protein
LSRLTRRADQPGGDLLVLAPAGDRGEDGHLNDLGVEDQFAPPAPSRPPAPARAPAVATTTTLRARLITVPARLARSARHLTHAPTPAMALHEHWTRLADHTLRPAASAAA